MAQWMQYMESLIGDDDYGQDDVYLLQRNDFQGIMTEFQTSGMDILHLIEFYGVPRNLSLAFTRRIIRFVLRNAGSLTGTLDQNTARLYTQFTAQDRVVIPLLRAYRVPETVIGQYIREVIRFTLRNIERVPLPGINQEVQRLLREFERQNPTFLGLTTTYRIPVGIARNIVRDIIDFTLLNINRIPQTGTIQQRTEAMLRLLDAERPELIRQMIRRGVPAAQAETITRQIILFTLSNMAMPR